jgi:adenine-specific DNA-methyltransferase
MNYIGSKLSLLEFLDESISQVADKNCKVFCDLFAGTGIVVSYFKKKGFQIIANDIQYYSYVLNKHYIYNNQPLEFNGLESAIPELCISDNSLKPALICDYLSNIKGIEGFIYNNYCLGSTKGTEFERQYFSDYNGKKCDTIRQTIEGWFANKLITENEYFYLLAALLESIDKYANTASVYGAYLKHLKKTAQKHLIIKPINIIESDKEHQVFNRDIKSLVTEIKGDILYLDPPYNHRQYGANYHILETIARYDNPVISGKTGLRKYKKEKSKYCSKTHAKKEFSELISKANAKYIFLSYNNEGVLSLEEIKEIMSSRGKYGFFTKEYNRFKADRDANRDYSANSTTEYLHYVVVGN